MDDKYSNMDLLSAFGFLANAMGGGGDAGQSFPQSDAEDLSRGLRFIPGEVTIARRRGELVEFVQPCANPNCWYWSFLDGSQFYYYESESLDVYGIDKCRLCGNEHIFGGLVVK